MKKLTIAQVTKLFEKNKGKTHIYKVATFGDEDKKAKYLDNKLLVELKDLKNTDVNDLIKRYNFTIRTTKKAHQKGSNVLIEYNNNKKSKLDLRLANKYLIDNKFLIIEKYKTIILYIF